MGLRKNRRKIFENQEDENASDNFIDALKKFSRGQIDKYELQDMDDSITVFNGSPLGTSEVVVEFENDNELFKVIGLSEDDIWFEGMVNSTYNNWEFTEFRQTLDDFLEGYGILSYFNQENNEKLKLISDLILPEKEFNIDGEEFRVEFSRLLYDLFEGEIENIISEFTHYKDREMIESAQNTINSELDESLKRLGFEFYTKYYEISTTVTNLRVWAVRLGITDVPDAKTLITKIFEENEDRSLGGWSDMMYEFQDEQYFDDKNFNDYVERQLDTIIESLEEEMEEGGLTIGNFLNLKKRILDKFEMNKWYKLPKDPKITYQINGFDRDNMRIKVLISHPTKGIKELNLTEENFYNFLYQLELFDRFDT